MLGYVIDERINHSDNEQPVDNYFVSELVFDKKNWYDSVNESN